MGIAKILANFSIAAIVWWAVGFGWPSVARDAARRHRVLLPDRPVDRRRAGDLYGETVSGGTAAFFIFQFMFCAVSLAIVWGTTLERMKFVAYVPVRDRLRRPDLPADRPLGLRRRPVHAE
jgi:Amt family ammonium transporter